MKHSWFPAVIVFTTVLSVGYFIGAPLYCRGGFDIPVAILDRAQVCAGPGGLTRSASMLFYFASVGFALFVGIIADKLPRRALRTAEPKKAEEKTPAPAKEAVEPAAVAVVAPSVAAIPEAPKTETVTPGVVAPVAAPVIAAPTPTPVPEPMDLAAAVEAALKVNQPAPAPMPAVPAPVVAPPPVPTPSIATGPSVATAPLVLPPAPVLPPPSKPAPLVKPWRQQKPFDGTNDELIARIKELTKEGGVEAIATAQRNLDESTLSALGGGVDPKQHLSQIAHLLLIEDPELKSEVARGVIIHIAARLKELGVIAGLPV